MHRCSTKVSDQLRILTAVVAHLNLPLSFRTLQISIDRSYKPINPKNMSVRQPFMPIYEASGAQLLKDMLKKASLYDRWLSHKSILIRKVLQNTDEVSLNRIPGSSRKALGGMMIKRGIVEKNNRYISIKKFHQRMDKLNAFILDAPNTLLVKLANDANSQPCDLHDCSKSVLNKYTYKIVYQICMSLVQNTDLLRAILERFCGYHRSDVRYCVTEFPFTPDVVTAIVTDVKSKLANESMWDAIQRTYKRDCDLLEDVHKRADELTEIIKTKTVSELVHAYYMSQWPLLAEIYGVSDTSSTEIDTAETSVIQQNESVSNQSNTDRLDVLEQKLDRLITMVQRLINREGNQPLMVNDTNDTVIEKMTNELLSAARGEQEPNTDDGSVDIDEELKALNESDESSQFKPVTTGLFKDIFKPANATVETACSKIGKLGKPYDMDTRNMLETIAYSWCTTMNTRLVPNALILAYLRTKKTRITAGSYLTYIRASRYIAGWSGANDLKEEGRHLLLTDAAFHHCEQHHGPTPQFLYNVVEFVVKQLCSKSEQLDTILDIIQNGTQHNVPYKTILEKRPGKHPNASGVKSACLFYLTRCVLQTHMENRVLYRRVIRGPIGEELAIFQQKLLEQSKEQKIAE